MRRGAAIGIDDDLAPRQACVAIGPADLERTRGVDMPLCIGIDPTFGQQLGDDALHIGLELGFLGALVIALGVLGGDDHRSAGHRRAVFIAQRDLALGVGFKERRRTALAIRRQPFENLVAVVDRRRHEIGGLVAGKTEHDALVARAFVLIAIGIDALRDFGGLAMQMVLEGQRLPVEAVLFIADFAHRTAHGLFDFFLCARRPAGVFGPVEVLRIIHRRAANLAREDDALRRGHGFAGNPRLGILGQHQIDDGIGDLVGNLVRMAFRNALGSKEETGAHEGRIPDIKKSLCVPYGVASRTTHGNQR